MEGSMTVPVYQVGDRAVVSTVFTDENGVATNPVTVVAEYRRPSATVATSIGTTNPSTGTYRATLPTFDEPGLWAWYIAGTVGLIAADQGLIFVAAKLTA
jgi:hypothetical protein